MSSSSPIIPGEGPQRKPVTFRAEVTPPPPLVHQGTESPVTPDSVTSFRLAPPLEIASVLAEILVDGISKSSTAIPAGNVEWCLNRRCGFMPVGSHSHRPRPGQLSDRNRTDINRYLGAAILTTRSPEQIQTWWLNTVIPELGHVMIYRRKHGLVVYHRFKPERYFVRLPESTYRWNVEPQARGHRNG